MSNRLPGTFYGALIFSACIVVFSHCRTFGLVNCDDYDYLRFAADGAQSVFGIGQSIFMPLTWITYRLDLTLAPLLGTGIPQAAHLQSLLWHGANAVLLYVLLNRLFASAGPLTTALAVLAWACHPLRVESVVWVASRKDVVSMFFLLVAWHSWLSFRRTRSIPAYVASFAAMLAGCCAKPSVMVFPVLAALVDIFLFGERCWLHPRKRAGTVATYLPHFALALATAAFASYAQAYGGAMNAQSAVPLWWRLGNAMTSVGVYLVNSAWPLDLAPQCLMRWPAWPRAFLSRSAVCLAALALVWALWKGRRHAANRGMLCGLLVFLAALVPFLGVIGFGIHAFADRFTYIPALGLSILAVVALERTRTAGLLFGLVLVSLLGLQTVRQVRHWANDATIWRQTLRVDGPANCDALEKLGLYHFEFTHDLDKAADCFRRAYAANPERCGQCLLLLVLAQCEKGDRDAARAAYMDLSEWDVREVSAAKRQGKSVSSTIAYQIGRIAYLMGDADMKDAMAAETRRLHGLLPEDVTVKYLRYLLGEIKAEAVTASDPYEYVQYRFLRSKCGR